MNIVSKSYYMLIACTLVTMVCIHFPGCSHGKCPIDTLTIEKRYRLQLEHLKRVAELSLWKKGEVAINNPLNIKILSTPEIIEAGIRHVTESKNYSYGNNVLAKRDINDYDSQYMVYSTFPQAELNKPVIKAHINTLSNGNTYKTLTYENITVNDSGQHVLYYIILDYNMVVSEKL